MYSAERPPDLLFSSAISPTGENIVLGRNGGSVESFKISDSATKSTANVPSFAFDSRGPIDIHFSPVGDLIVLTGRHTGVAVPFLDATTLRPIARYAEQADTAAFDARGKLLALAGAPKDIRIRSLDGAAATQRIETPFASSPTSMAFSFDDAFLITNSVDRIMRIWRLADGEIVDQFPSSDIYMKVSVDSDASRIFVPCREGGGVCKWESFRSLRLSIKDARQRATRCLSPEQRQQFFLSPEPPFWCIEQKKYPYLGATWEAWMKMKKNGAALSPPASRKSLFGISMTDTSTSQRGDTTGAMVTRISPKSPAEAAGIQPGDLIRRVNGIDVNNAIEANLVLSQALPDTPALIEVMRAKSPLRIAVKPVDLDQGLAIWREMQSR